MHASYNQKTFVDSFVVTSLNRQRLSAGEVSGLRRCRPHVAAVAGEWGRPIYQISVLFLHLVVFKYIALNVLVVCRSSSICSSNQSFGSIQLCIVILCPSPSAACSVSTFSLYDSLSPTTCVLLVSHLFVCFISGSHQASVAVFQIWKDAVVKQLSSSQEFGGG